MQAVLARARYVVVLPVLGTFVASVALHVFGLLRAGRLAMDAMRAAWWEEAGFDAKRLILESVVVIDVFLVATAFLIIAAGLYELFVGELLLPDWLQFHDFDDLKARLAAVIVVGLLVAFLGEVLSWTGGLDILGLGGGIAAVSVATGVVFGFARREGRGAS